MGLGTLAQAGAGRAESPEPSPAYVCSRARSVCTSLLTRGTRQPEKSRRFVAFSRGSPGGTRLALGPRMLPLLLALSVAHAGLRPAPATYGEMTAGAPGLGQRVSGSAGTLSHGDGVRLAAAPLHVGWRVAEGVPVEAPTEFGAAALEMTVGGWLEARIGELRVVETTALDARSYYLDPVSAAVEGDVSLLPWLAVSGRLELTLSIFQATHARETANENPPLLLCSSGSLAQAVVGTELRPGIALFALAGIGDDPVHFDDGADCLGGGPVWQSSRWVGARAEVELGPSMSLGMAVGHVEYQRHAVLSGDHGGDGTSHAQGEAEGHGHGHDGGHEEVEVRGHHGVEGGAWLSASF